MRMTEMILSRERRAREEAAKKAHQDQVAKEEKARKKQLEDASKEREKRRREALLRQPREYYAESYGDVVLFTAQREELIKGNRQRITAYEKVAEDFAESGEALGWDWYLSSTVFRRMRRTLAGPYVHFTLGVTADNSGRMHVFLKYADKQVDWYTRDGENPDSIDELVGQAIEKYYTLI